MPPISDNAPYRRRLLGEKRRYVPPEERFLISTNENQGTSPAVEQEKLELKIKKLMERVNTLEAKLGKD